MQIRKSLPCFFSEASFEKLTGRKVDVKPGTYLTITATDYKESFWDFVDGLHGITNPETGKCLSVTYAGSIEYDTLYQMSDPYAYVLCDLDYQKISEEISSDYKEHIVLFDVKDFDNSYEFAKDLLEQYIFHTTTISNHYGNYDLWEAYLAHSRGLEYGYDGEVDLQANTALLLNDWKYAPGFTIITSQDYMQLICIYVMLCLYIFIITLTAVAIMCYVRSVSIAEKNKTLFGNLTKLGASQDYQRRIMKKQLAKIFLYPGALGCTVGMIYSIGLSFSNDRRFSFGEVQGLARLFGICVFIGIFLFVVYSVSKKKAEKIIGI